MKKQFILVGTLLLISTFAFAQEKETAIEEVTIANKTSQQLYETGKNVILLTQKDLEKYKGQNLNDILQQVSGFQITGNFNGNQEPKSPKIRGGKLANFLVLVDGVPMKDVTGNDYNAMDLRLIAAENVESIEVLNGASSVLYGSNATVSVINIKTKKSSTKKLQGEIGARGGSFGTYAQNAGVRGNISGFTYQVSGFNEKSNGLSSALGEDFDKDGFEKQNILANVGYHNERFSVNLNSGWNHNLFSYDNGAFTDGKKRGEDQQFYLGGNVGYNYKNGALVANIRHSTNERALKDFDGQAFYDQYLYKGDNFFGEIYNTYNFGELLKLTGGFQYEKQSMSYSEKPWNSPTLQEVLDFDNTNVYFADVFVNANFKYKKFRLDAGGRLVNHSKFKSHFVYSINPYFLQELNGLYLKAGYSFATAFIAPTLYQNFGDIYTLPNPDLKPETNESHEIDLSFGNKERTFVINASLFQRNERDIFVYQLNPNFTGMFVNEAKNKAKGFEFGADYTINKYLKVGGNYSFVEKDNQATMLRQPKHRVNSYVEISPLRFTRLVLSHQYVDKRSDVFYDSNFIRQDVVVGSFNLFNLNVNQKITNALEAYVNIGNLFNTSYVDVVGYTTKPRFYTVGLGYKF
ncbi:MAG: TonB-dependent receptor [Cruoricaptor ignavus]|nr:TonB-dependent receptor [Cruoricaptor ignavus]